MPHFKIPYTWPFKMVPNDGGMHFDDQWAVLQIREHQIKVPYKQKWIKSVTTTLQVESSVQPPPLLLKNRSGATVKSFTWAPVVFATGYNIYETIYDVTDIGEDTYFLYQTVSLSATLYEFISEPILSVSTFPNILMFRYKNSFNKDDTAWTTGLEMIFMCEADIQDFEPEADETDFINQIQDTVNLDSIPSRMFQLYVGDARYNYSGVAPYILDILNRIFACDYISIGRPGGKMMQYNNKSGSKWRVTRNRNYPLIGGAIDLVPRFNSQSQEASVTTPLPEGFIAAYNIETGFFGPGSIMPIIEVEENG